MIVQNDGWRHVSIHSHMRTEEMNALYSYVEANGMKIGPLVRVLILRELKEKNVLNDMPSGYTIPDARIVAKKKRERIVQPEKV